MAHPTVQEAIDAADPGVADLIGRLATEELQTEPFDAVARLLTEWARQEVAELTLKATGRRRRRAARAGHVAEARRRASAGPGHRGRGRGRVGSLRRSTG